MLEILQYYDAAALLKNCKCQNKSKCDETDRILNGNNFDNRLN